MPHAPPAAAPSESAPSASLAQAGTAPPPLPPPQSSNIVSEEVTPPCVNASAKISPEAVAGSSKSHAEMRSDVTPALSAGAPSSQSDAGAGAGAADTASSAGGASGST